MRTNQSDSLASGSGVVRGRRWNVLIWVVVIGVGLSGLWGAAGDRGQGAVIKIPAGFSREHTGAVRGQIDRVVEAGADTVIFVFSGTSVSFGGCAELAEAIDALSERGIHTIGYLSDDTYGMTMLGVLACREIAAKKHVQFGKVLPLESSGGGKGKGSVKGIDEQKVIHKLMGFAEAGGHDRLIARAMADPEMFVYLMEREGKRKVVDQSGFEAIGQSGGSDGWRLKRKLDVSGESLLLSGQEGFEAGLVSRLSRDTDELARAVGVELISVRLTSGVAGDDPNTAVVGGPKAKAEKDVEEGGDRKIVVIPCRDMVDDGLYESIKRRTEAAIEDGADYIIYEIDTFGGALHSAISIWDYWMQDVGERVHTVAYVPTKAISAGALISVACKDIIMKKATLIGDCAPIIMGGGKLEGVEREKVESPTRTYFVNAAKANGYPVALCKAMVTMNLEVYQVKNLQTNEYEYFEENDLPTDSFVYDLEGKKLIVKGDQLLTLGADEAYSYGLARVVVDDLEGAIAFLEERDKVTFGRPVETVDTNWSEGVVRWLNSPAVAGILLMVGLLGVYAELNSPGLGFPGAVAVIALVILFGSKYLIGMANWWEIAVFGIGILLILVEIVVLPGFGVAGISGTLLIVFSFVAMMVANRPDEFPLPRVPLEWELLERNFYGFLWGVLGFMVGAYYISKYIGRLPFANKLVLDGPQGGGSSQTILSDRPEERPAISVGERGVSLTQLRPAGRVRFGRKSLDVVSRGELIEADKNVVVVETEGNRIVVKEG